MFFTAGVIEAGGLKMHLGLDIGSSSIKALLFDGPNHYKASADYPAGYSCFEQDAKMVSEAVKAAIQKLIKTHNIKPDKITTIGLCGHGPSIVFVDKAGTAVTPVITWQDTRALKEAAELRGRWPGFEKDGTSYEAKLLWYYRNFQELCGGGYTALYPKDYLVLLLTGRCCMDCSTASAIVYYDRNSKSWSSRGILPLEMMPEVVDSWEESGQTATGFSRDCGLPDGIPVFSGGIDCFCEAVGAGGLDYGTVVDGSGTSTCLTRAVERNDTASWHVLPDSALHINMLSSTGAAFKWFQNQIASGEVEALMEGIRPERPEHIIFLPYLSGERCPIWDEKARAVFLGIDGSTGKQQLLQAVLQGVGFAIRQNLDAMGQGINIVNAVGGGNRSDVWLQIKANICGVPFDKLEEQDASAFGAALIGAIGNKDYSVSDAKALVVVNKRFEPEAKCKAEYDGLYKNYKKLYPALKDIYHDMFTQRDGI